MKNFFWQAAEAYAYSGKGLAGSGFPVCKPQVFFYQKLYVGRRTGKGQCYETYVSTLFADWYNASGHDSWSIVNLKVLAKSLPVGGIGCYQNNNWSDSPS